MKPKPSTIFRIAAAASLLLGPSLHAIPIRILAWDQEIAGRKLAIAQTKGIQIIDAMHPARRTPAYQVAGGDIPVAIQALDKTDQDGKPAVSRISLPAGTRQPLLLLLPDPKSATGLRLIVLEDDMSGLPWGSTRFINTCGKKLAFVYEKKLVALPPSWDPVLVKPGGVQRNMEVQLYFHEKPERPIYSAVWEQNPEERMLIFLVPGEDPRLGPVAMKMISEDRRLVAVEEDLAKKAAAKP